MIGAGFIKDMISSSKSNRTLLKGDGGSKYNNFDKSYITDWVVSRKIPKYRKASPEYLTKLRAKLQAEREINKRNRIKAWIYSIGASGVLLLLFLYVSNML